jgi:hypothetical protein
MLLESPTKVSQDYISLDVISLDVREIEPLL